jgi:hypothetical protein
LEFGEKFEEKVIVKEIMIRLLSVAAAIKHKQNIFQGEKATCPL